MIINLQLRLHCHGLAIFPEQALEKLESFSFFLSSMSVCLCSNRGNIYIALPLCLNQMQ